MAGRRLRHAGKRRRSRPHDQSTRRPGRPPWIWVRGHNGDIGRAAHVTSGRWRGGSAKTQKGGCYIIFASPSGILRAPYFEFWCERSVLVFAGRGDQGQLVPASLYCPYAFRVSPWRKTCCLDFPDYFFSCFVHCIRAVIGDHRSIRLSRIICFHRGYWGTNNNLGEPVSPSERNLPL